MLKGGWLDEDCKQSFVSDSSTERIDTEYWRCILITRSVREVWRRDLVSWKSFNKCKVTNRLDLLLTSAQFRTPRPCHGLLLQVGLAGDSGFTFFLCLLSSHCWVGKCPVVTINVYGCFLAGNWKDILLKPTTSTVDYVGLPAGNGKGTQKQNIIPDLCWVF